ncbi:hypothetical protein ACFQHN_18905 [Natrialbaceae archaeon GCM10025896]
MAEVGGNRAEPTGMPERRVHARSAENEYRRFALEEGADYGVRSGFRRRGQSSVQ